MRAQWVRRGLAAAALVAVAVFTGMLTSRWSAHDSRGHTAASSVVTPGGRPAPSAQEEAGHFSTMSFPPDRFPSLRPGQRRARSARARPAASTAAVHPTRKTVRAPEARAPVDVHDAAGPLPATASPEQPAATGQGAAAPPGAGAREPQVGQDAPSVPPAPAVALPAQPDSPKASPPTPALTPPVPIDVPPPRHPLPYRLVVDTPGLGSSARLEAVEARVRLRLAIRADGRVAGVEIAVSSGRAELDGAALGAARQWRFLPARRDGEAIDSVALIWVAFVARP